GRQNTQGRWPAPRRQDVGRDAEHGVLGLTGSEDTQDQGGGGAAAGAARVRPASGGRAAWGGERTGSRSGSSGGTWVPQSLFTVDLADSCDPGVRVAIREASRSDDVVSRSSATSLIRTPQ